MNVIIIRSNSGNEEAPRGIVVSSRVENYEIRSLTQGRANAQVASNSRQL